MTTNLERIRQMTTEELAKFFYATKNSCTTCVAKNHKCIGNKHCIEFIKQWLEQEVEE